LIKSSFLNKSDSIKGSGVLHALMKAASQICVQKVKISTVTSWLEYVMKFRAGFNKQSSLNWA